MFVKTLHGKRCPFPDGLVVTEKSVDVPNSSFLRRRLKDGSVILTTKTQLSERPLTTEKTNKKPKAGGQ